MRVRVRVQVRVRLGRKEGGGDGRPDDLTAAFFYLHVRTQPAPFLLTVSFKFNTETL